MKTRALWIVSRLAIAQTLPNQHTKPHHRSRCKIHQRNVKQPRRQPLSQYKPMDTCNSHVLLYSRTRSQKSSHTQWIIKKTASTR